MSNQKFSSGKGKGYYIALILCAAAIGISGYLYYRNTNEDDASLQAPVNATEGDNVEAVATQPGSTGTATEPSQTTSPTQKQKMKTAAPVEGDMVAAFSMDALSYNETTRDWRVHNGVDIAAEAGTQVNAAADGEVYTVYEDDTMGYTVVIRHDDGYVTKYASLAADVLVSPGETVTVGQAIGAVGSTALLESALGDHVHFSVTCNDEAVDPMEFIGE